MVNTSPNRMVRYMEILEEEKLEHSIEWCAHVTLTPDDRRIIVFSSGILTGLNVRTARGGQLPPSSNVGEILLCR